MKKSGDFEGLGRVPRGLHKEKFGLVETMALQQICGDAQRDLEPLAQNLFKNGQPADMQRFAASLARIAGIKDRLTDIEKQGFQNTQENNSLFYRTLGKVEATFNLLREYAKSLNIEVK